MSYLATWVRKQGPDLSQGSGSGGLPIPFICISGELGQVLDVDLTVSEKQSET